ncbi:MAG: GNAT family N-acetyltransferase [Anaeromyxobacteraceae bacterium]
MKLRRGTLADAPACARVMRAAILGLARGTVPARTLAAWSSLPPLYHRWAMSVGGERYLVAEHRGRVVAYAALHGRELSACFVHPRHARRGLGARLVRTLLARARRAGHASVVALAAPGAVPFYEALGFRYGPAVRVPLPGGVAVRAVKLRCRTR